jgi:hypothetical protein
MVHARAMEDKAVMRHVERLTEPEREAWLAAGGWRICGSEPAESRAASTLQLTYPRQA